MRVLTRKWWQEPVGTRSTPREAASAPREGLQEPRRGRWSPGKWILRAWHALMLYSIVMGLSKVGGAHPAALGGGFFIAMLFWALGVWIINTLRRSFV